MGSLYHTCVISSQLLVRRIDIFPMGSLYHECVMSSQLLVRRMDISQMGRVCGTSANNDSL